MNALLGRIAGRLLGGGGASARTRMATEAFEAGLAHHREGRIRDALAAYRQALGHDPNHFDAIHMTGVALQQTGASAEAIAHLERATALVAHDPAGHNNLGVAYLSAGRHEDAAVSLRKAIALKPEWDQPHNNLGSVMRSLDRLDDAEVAFASAVRLNPHNHGALANLANLCKERGQLDRAEQAFRQLVALDPAAAENWNGLADALAAGERFDEALACYRKALEIAPGTRTFNGIGVVQQKRGDWAEALAWFRRAASADARSFEAARNLALALDRTGDAEAARIEIERALALRPDDPDALAVAAAIQHALGDAAGAEAHCRRALARAPRHVDAQLALGIVARARGDYDAAERAFGEALAAQPACAAASYQLAMTALARQDYAQGFALFDSRFAAVKGTAWDLPQHRRRLADPRRWQGEDLAGRRLLVWGEQGFGDVIMALRYLPLLGARGAGEVVVQCEAPLVRLVRHVEGVAEAIADDVPLPPQRYDLHCPVMSLPHLFATRLDTIPRDVPYLAVPGELVAAFAARVSKLPATRVGIVWTTGSTIAEHARRNVPLRALAPILDACGTVVSLQKGDAAADAAAFGDRIVDGMDACTDFLDTAALVRNLDLVVSVDTAVAHLAGALGVPVFLFNRYRGDWRWGPQGEDASWYPTMRIFAQQEPADWDPAIRRAAAEIAGFRRAARKAGRMKDGDRQVRELDPQGFNELRLCRNGPMLYNKHDIYVGGSLRKYGEFSAAEQEVFGQLVKPGATVVEVGANVGAHTVDLARWAGRSGEVHAFEPQRIVFQTLCANLALNQCTNVFAKQAGVGAANGTIVVPAIDPATRYNFGGVMLHGDGPGERVPLVTLDSLALRACSFLKVDVEGMEIEVLKGGEATIRACRPFMFIENDREEHSEEFLTRVFDLGYRAFWHYAYLFNPNNFAGDPEDIFPRVASVNILCVPAEINAQISGLRPVASVKDTWRVVP